MTDTPLTAPSEALLDDYVAQAVHDSPDIDAEAVRTKFAARLAAIETAAAERATVPLLEAVGEVWDWWESGIGWHEGWSGTGRDGVDYDLTQMSRADHDELDRRIQRLDSIATARHAAKDAEIAALRERTDVGLAMALGDERDENERLREWIERAPHYGTCLAILGRDDPCECGRDAVLARHTPASAGGGRTEGAAAEGDGE